MPRPIAILATDVAFWEPGTGSHGRIEQVCALLARRFDLSVLVFREVGPRARTRIEARGYPFDIVPYGSLTEAAAAVPDAVSGAVDPHLRRWYVPDWQRAFLALVDRLRPRLVVIEYVRLQYLVEGLPEGVLTVLDSHDIMSSRSVSFLTFGMEPSIGFPCEVEAALLRRFDFVLAISESDRDWLRRFVPRQAVVLLPFLPVDEAGLPEPRGRGPTDLLLFAGSNAPANAAALRWFSDYAWPYLRDEMRLAVFGGVGASAPDDPHVEVRGVVESVDEIYEDYAVVLNPVFVGGGLKIKSLEAIAAGLPLVASREGLRGLESFEGEGVVLARSRAEFIAGVRAQARAAHAPAALKAARRPALAAFRAQARGGGFLEVLERLATLPPPLRLPA